VLEQHLTLIVVTHAVQRGGKHQLRRGHKQPKGNLISQRRTLDIAGAHAKAHGGGIGGDQTQTPPQGHKAMVLGTLNQPVVELRDGGHGQFGARLREGLFRNVAHELRLLAQMGEKRVEFGLDAHAHAAQ
jgi:hypothetical protein